MVVGDGSDEKRDKDGRDILCIFPLQRSFWRVIGICGYILYKVLENLPSMIEQMKTLTSNVTVTNFVAPCPSRQMTMVLFVDMSPSTLIESKLCSR